MSTTDVMQKTEPADRPEKQFAGELSIPFEQAAALVTASSGAAPRAPQGVAARIRSLLGLRSNAVEAAGIGQDGFHGEVFEEKLERGRRYGGVYRLREENNGYFLEFEFARHIPPSAAAETLGVGGEMPDYDYTLDLQDRYFTVKGALVDPSVRRVAAASGAFPPDFTTRILLPESVAGFRHRLRNKTLEVALPREARAAASAPRVAGAERQ